MDSVWKTVLYLWILALNLTNGEITEEHPYVRNYTSWVRSSTKSEFRAIQAQQMKQFMNDSVDPCEDFYQYACGNWGKSMPKSEDENDDEVSVTSVLTNIPKRLVSELISSEVQETDTESEAKAKEFYASCMDCRTKSYAQLKDFLRTFGSWPAFDTAWSDDDFDWLNLTAYAKLYNLNVFFTVEVENDDRRYGKFINTFDIITGTGYRSDEEAYRTRLFKYTRGLPITRNYLNSMVGRLQDFEKKLDQLVTLHNSLATNEMYGTIEDVKERVKDFPFEKYLTIVGGRRALPSQIIYVKNVGYMNEIVELLSETDPHTIIDHIFWRIIDEHATYGPMFHAEYDVPATCMRLTKELMESAITSLFVKNYFPIESKIDVRDMIERVRTAGLKSLNASEWMDQNSKEHAIKKLSVVKPYVGYPDYMESEIEVNRDYLGITIDRNNFLPNIVKLKRNLVRLGQLRTRGENTRVMDVITVNAFYSQTHKGELELPAAILQAPFYHLYSPVFLNYGATGATVGHEFMHGFDNDLFNYDAEGEHRQWWNERLNRTYLTRTECFCSQYNKFERKDLNLTLDGGRTLAENLSDNEGVKLAYLAYKDWLETTENSTESELEQFSEFNLTPTQLFFLSFAQSYCDASGPKRINAVMQWDEHSPDEFRILGSLSNSKEFAEEFNCPIGTRYNPERKCKYLRK